jgi:CrcB protein
LSDAWRYAVPIGFIGAYSTFSTFEFEAWADFTRGAYWSAALYVGLSLLGGFLAIFAGVAAARAIS